MKNTRRLTCLVFCLIAALLALWLTIAAIHSPQIVVPRVRIDPLHCGSPVQDQQMHREQDPFSEEAASAQRRTPINDQNDMLMYRRDGVTRSDCASQGSPRTRQRPQ